MVTAKRAVRDRVKRSAQDPSRLLGTADGAHAIHDFARRAPGERQEQDSFGRDAPFKEDLDPSGERCRLAGTGSGHDPQRTVTERRRFTLSCVEISLQGEHTFDSISGT